MKRKGFTIIEILVVLAIVSILAAILVPVVIKNMKDAYIARTKNETIVISSAILTLHKDTGKWPFTNLPGPSGGVNRVVGDVLHIPAERAPKARPGAENWGTLGEVKPLSDYLFYNNPDENSGPLYQKEPGQDYPVRGKFAWNGPYIDYEVLDDPWGNSYVVNARYFPGNPLGGEMALEHRVYVLSAGPDGMWSTAFSDTINRMTRPNDSPYGDDIGFIILTNGNY